MSRTGHLGDQVVLEWVDWGPTLYWLEATDSLEPPVRWRTVWSGAGRGQPGELIAITNSLVGARRYYQLWRE